MKCNKCNNEGVRNEVLGKEFYYCRTCKVEIREFNLPDAKHQNLYSVTSLLPSYQGYGNSIPNVIYAHPPVTSFKVGDKVTVKPSRATNSYSQIHTLSAASIYTITAVIVDQVKLMTKGDTLFLADRFDLYIRVSP